MKSFYRALSIFSVFIIPILLFVFFVIYKKDLRLYMFLTEEDQVVEWLTFAFLFLSGVLSFVIAGIRKKSGAPYFLFFFGFGALCLLFAFEEISWGQRLFGAASPEFFMEHSDQKEINFHNVIQKQYNLKTKFVASRVRFYFGTVFPIVVYDRRIRAVFKRLRSVLRWPRFRGHWLCLGRLGWKRG